MSDFIMGVDLGQQRDYSAIVLLEVGMHDTGKTKQASTRDGLLTRPVPIMERRYAARHIERLALGTSYPAQVARLVALKVHLEREQHTVKLVVDQTGVGRPVVDMLRAAKLKPVAVTITGGDSVTRDGSDYRVPKRDLVSTVQVLFDTDRLKIARALPEAQTLIDELLAFKVSISLKGHDSYGNDVGRWREGAHDDLVLATALAVWRGESPKVTSPEVAASLYRW
jgi:hypothetical protein